MNEFLVTLTARHREDGSMFITCNEVPFVNVVGPSEAKATEMALRILKETLEANHSCSVVDMRPVGDASDLVHGCRQSRAMPGHVIAQIAPVAA